MSRILVVIMLIGSFVFPTFASEYEPPPVPDSGAEIMPGAQSFGEGLLELLNNALMKIDPEFRSALAVSASAFVTVLLISCLQSFSSGTEQIADLTGIVAISVLLLTNTNAMIRLGSSTVTDISEYGKLLLPVMTAALAAQGGLTSSAALYVGTAAFNSVLNSLISKLLVPMVYFFLALAVASGAVGDSIFKNMRDLIKSVMSWCLKTLLIVFTTYMSITGVVSGTTDAAALKATKVAISSFVPVVGGILSDASEAVLVSAGLAKNAAGIYGIYAILAVFAVPFLRIGIHYLVLKATGALCGIFGSKRVTDLIGDFSTAMGLLLAMTGSACLLQLISTVCFLKGVGS